MTVTDTSRILALDLYGTLSRTLIGLGMGDKIVGRTVSSTQKQLHDLPVITENGHTLNVEAIAALKPTFVIADRSVGPREALDQLRKSGIPVVLVNPHRSVDRTADLIRTVAKAVGKPAAGEVLVKRARDEIDAAKEEITQWAPKKPMKITFLYVRGTAGIFFILGSQDGASELIHGVGGDDVAGDKGIKSVAPANAESLVSPQSGCHLRHEGRVDVHRWHEGSAGESWGGQHHCGQEPSRHRDPRRYLLVLRTADR